jgi:hypothetical protein
MYQVLDQQGNTVAICSRKEDAEALASTQLDHTVYKIVEQKVDNTHK